MFLGCSLDIFGAQVVASPSSPSPTKRVDGATASSLPSTTAATMRPRTTARRLEPGGWAVGKTSTGIAKTTWFSMVFKGNWESVLFPGFKVYKYLQPIDLRVLEAWGFEEAFEE